MNKLEKRLLAEELARTGSPPVEIPEDLPSEREGTYFQFRQDVIQILAKIRGLGEIFSPTHPRPTSQRVRNHAAAGYDPQSEFGDESWNRD